MRKALVLVFALLLLGAACGGEDEAELTTTEGTSEPGATETAAPEGTPKPGGTSSGGSGGQATGGSAQQTSAPVQPAPEGKINRPRAGTYVYDLDGQASDPLNPAAPPQDYAEDAEATVDVSRDGDINTAQASNTESPGVTTLRSKWEATRVLLLSLKTETPLGDFNCVFDPPMEIAHIPPKVETFPTQNWKCKGEEGQGKTDIQVVGKETVKDAKGKSWSTWKVLVKTESTSPDFSIKQDDTRWVSPDLGVEIRSDGKASGSFKTQAGTTQNFSATSKTTLNSYP